MAVGSGKGDDVVVVKKVAVASGVDVFVGVAGISSVGVDVGLSAATGLGVAMAVGVAVRVGTRGCEVVGSGVAVNVGSGVGMPVAINVGATAVGVGVEVGVAVEACWANTQPVAASNTTAANHANTFSCKISSPLLVKPLAYNTLLKDVFGTRTVDGSIMRTVRQLSDSSQILYR